MIISLVGLPGVVGRPGVVTRSFVVVVASMDVVVGVAGRPGVVTGCFVGGDTLGRPGVVDLVNRGVVNISTVEVVASMDVVVGVVGRPGVVTGCSVDGDTLGRPGVVDLRSVGPVGRPGVVTGFSVDLSAVVPGVVTWVLPAIVDGVSSIHPVLLDDFDESRVVELASFLVVGNLGDTSIQLVVVFSADRAKGVVG